MERKNKIKRKRIEALRLSIKQEDKLDSKIPCIQGFRSSLKRKKQKSLELQHQILF